MKTKIGTICGIGAVACAMLASLFQPACLGNPDVSEAASAISYRMMKGDKVKIKTIVSKSKLSAAKKKKVSSLTWKSKNKKIVKISKKKLTALKAGKAKIVGYQKKKKKRKKYITLRITVVAKPKLTRTTQKGKVKGRTVVSKTAMAWYGIPYAATTAGANRWKAPQPLPA